jgi:hypothetical protein
LFGRVVEQGIAEGIFHLQYPSEAVEILIVGIHFITDLGIFKWSKEQYMRKLLAAEDLIEKAFGIEQGGFRIISEMNAKAMEHSISFQGLYNG